MKFSDIEQDQWEGLAPFVDTCILPVTGLTGREQPWEATQALEALRDALDPLEIPYRGRVMTYPAFHYCAGPAEGWQLSINETCAQLKSTGFRFVIIVTLTSEISKTTVPEADHIFFYDQSVDRDKKQFDTNIRLNIEQLWKTALSTLHE